MNYKSIRNVGSLARLWFGVMLAALVSTLIFVGCAVNPASEDGEGGSGDGGGGGGGGGGGTNPSITIKNNTGYSFWSLTGGLWIKPSTESQNWGSNLVGWDDFYDGTSRTFTLSQPLFTQSIYDFRLDAGDFSFKKYGITVSNGMTITFTTNDVNNGSSQPTIIIQNRSGKTFNSVHIRPSVIADWGSSFGSVSNNSDLSATILIPPSNYTVFDIQMTSTNPTNTYTRNNVTISNGMALLFTSADADNPTIELPVIVIINSTGYSFWSLTGGLWIKPSSSTSWGNNLVGWDDFYDGTSRAFSLSQHLSAQNIYDIQLEAGGFNFTKNNVTVSEGMIIAFTTSDLGQ